MKKCKFCAEEIQDDAKKCRFCGEWIEKRDLNSALAKGLETKKIMSSKKVFSFWKTFVYSAVSLVIVFSLFIYLVEGFGEEYLKTFLFILAFSCFVGVLIADFIRGLKNSSKLSDEDKVKYNGLEGWLAFVALGLIVSFGQGLYGFYLIWKEYSEYVIPEGLIVILIGLASLLFHSYVAYLFFSKKRVFPKWWGISLIIIAALSILEFTYTDLNDLERQNISGDMGRSILAVMIWVPYILKSKRMKATFIKQ